MRTTVLIGSVLMSFRPRLLDAISAFVVVEAIAQRYDFKSFPKPEQLSAGPANFQFGNIMRDGRTVIIEQLLVQYVDFRATSVGATTKTSTDDAAFFLADLIQWVHSEFGLDNTKAHPDYFHSILEVAFDQSIRFADLQHIGEMITSLTRGYGLTTPDYAVNGISFHADPTVQTIPSPLPFTFERRAGLPFRENKYFSQAPLKTEDHERVLREIERLFTGGAPPNASSQLR